MKGLVTLKICLISWDKEAQLTYEKLKKFYQIEYVIERDDALWGSTPDGLQIISFSKAYHLFQEKQFDIFLIPAMRGINVNTGIFMRLRRNGIPAEKIWYAPLNLWNTTGSETSQKTIYPFEERRELDYVALHITDHCNLNCAYCSVFCGLVDKPSFPDNERTFNGIALLRKIYDQVLVFRILGGEPLLNDEWLKIALYIRELFPFADVEVVTNGLKILQISDADLSLMSDNRISFDISYYPIIGEKIDDIHKKLNEYNVVHYITQENEFFSRLYCFSHPGNSDHNYQVCKMKFMCLNMYEDRLAVCHALIGLERAREFIAPEIADKIQGCWVDLTTKGLDAPQILKLLDRPMPICQYCVQELAMWHPLSGSNNIHRPENWSII